METLVYKSNLAEPAITQNKTRVETLASTAEGAQSPGLEMLPPCARASLRRHVTALYSGLKKA